MASKKKAAVPAAKRLAKLESPSDIVADFVAGMKADKEVKESIHLLGDPLFKKRIKGVVSTRCATLDAAIGRGGFPLSRISILHGKEGCIAGSAKITLEYGLRRLNCSLATLCEMWSRDSASVGRILSLRADGSCGFARIKNVVDNGVRPLFRVVAGNYKLEATETHPVWARRYATRTWRWTAAGSLQEGDSIAVVADGIVVISGTGVAAQRVSSVTPIGDRQVYDVEVDEEGGFRQSFFANGVAVHNSGKTTLALELCAEVQSMGGIAMYIDKEHKLDPDYAESLGVDLSRMIMSAPSTLEGVVDQIKATTRRASEIRKKTKKPVPMLIIVDSLNACKAFETVQTETGTRRYPAEARIWSEELPGICEALAHEHVGLVFVSQVRKKMNVQFGNDEEMAGGNAPKFYASLVVYVTRVGTEKEGGKDGQKVASICVAECKKNQISPPFKKAKFAIYWNRGIDFEHSLILQLEEMGLVKKREKGLLRIGRVELGQGYAAAAKTLRKNEELRKRLLTLFRQKMKWEDSPAEAAV